jgi:hypothetical protein
LHLLRLDGPLDRFALTLASLFATTRDIARVWVRSVQRGSAAVRQARTASSASPAPSGAPPAPPPSRGPVGSALYRHTPHPHTPRDVNAVHHARHEQAGFNQRAAVWLTRHIGTMQTGYLFAAIGVGSLIGVFTNNVFLAALFGSISSYFLQLVLLPILSVGQNVLGQHAELQADETYRNTVRANHEMLQVMQHLSAQDDELLRQTLLLQRLIGTTAPPTRSPPRAVVGANGASGPGAPAISAARPAPPQARQVGECARECASVWCGQPARHHRRHAVASHAASRSPSCAAGAPGACARTTE